MSSSQVAGSVHGVRPVVDRLDSLSDAGHVSVRDIVAAFGDTSFLPLMMIPALLVISPLSGIPLFSSFCGLTIGLVAGQMAVGRSHVWLPGFVMRRRLRGAQLHKGAVWLRGFANWIDRHARQRLLFLFRYPMVLVPQLACVLSGLAMPLLELLPFSSSLLGTAVMLISVGFLVRDGLYLLGGAAFMGIAGAIPFAVAGTIAN